MARFTYLDFIKALGDDNIKNIIGEIDTDFLNSGTVESLYYSFPLIERMVLEIYKLVPAADVEHYEQGIMKTLLSIIQNNKVEVLPEQTIQILNKYYGDDGLRNQLLHPNKDIIDINVSFDEINYIIMQLMSILKRLLKENINYQFKDIESL